MANNAPNEVDEAIKALKEEQGYTAFVLLNNDGIVIRYENMDYKTAVQFSHLVLDLYSKTKKSMRELFEQPIDNEVESIRLKTNLCEYIIAQYGNFTLLVEQENANLVKAEEATEEGEGEEAAKE